MIKNPNRDIVDFRERFNRYQRKRNKYYTKPYNIGKGKPPCGIKKGDITNPRGRKKGSISVASAFRREFREADYSLARKLVKKWIDLAMKGNYDVMRVILDVTDTLKTIKGVKIPAIENIPERIKDL